MANERGTGMPASESFLAKTPATGIRNSAALGHAFDMALVHALLEDAEAELVVPVVVEGLFFANRVLYGSFEAVAAVFADFEMADGEKSPVDDDIGDGLPAHIAENSLHDDFSLPVLSDESPRGRRFEYPYADSISYSLASSNGKGVEAVRFFRMADRDFSPASALVIAEIGTGHGGDLGKARELVDAAADSGADCAKFQHVYADEIIHPKTGLVPLPGGDIPLFDRFKALELPLDFFRAVKEHAERRGLVFLCTPFGLRSARELRSIGVRAMKVASPELNFARLLDELASYRLPVILSSGVSRLSDIELALDRFPDRGDGDIALLHCVTAYPAPERDYNLRLLGHLSSLFGIPCGVSDHSMHPSLVPVLSVAMGGCVVEKHICLSRDDPGLDDPIALPPSDFAAMTRELRAAARLSPAELIADCEARFGADTVAAALGDGRKTLAPSERANYGRTNRSLHALRSIAQGERFDLSNVAELRTEKVLKPGLPPSLLSAVIGRRAARAVEDGQGIEWADVG